MTSLAQMIMDSPKWSQRQTADWHWESSNENAEFGSYVYEVVRNALTNESVPILDVSFLKTKATRFIFAEDAPSVTLNAIKGGMIDRGIPLKTARLPTSVCWIEWRIKDALAADQDGKSMILSGTSYVGVLLVQNWNPERVAFKSDGFIQVSRASKLKPAPVMISAPKKGGALALVVVKPEGSRPFPSLAFWIPPMPFDHPDEVSCSLFWSVNGGDANDSTATTTLKDIFYALFLINTPRVCEVREVTHHPKVQKRRAKDGRPPLVEYKQMVLRIGIGAPRYKTSGGATAGSALPGSKRKLHSVIGHFRTREYANRDHPEVSWVEEHYRGDPKLGIIIKDRHVRQ